MNGYTYDSLGQVNAFTSSVDGSVTYGYDATNQVTGADYTGAGQPADESYAYDDNGNRTNAGYSTGANNQLASDGTFNYTYDDEGNRISRTRVSSAPADDYLTAYTWDYRNRLTDVKEYDNSSVLTKHVHYTYDVFDHLIGKQVDSTGAGSFDQTARYVYDGADVVLQFDGAGSLTNRYLSAPGASGVDVVMAEEAVTSTSSPGTVTWPLTDNLGTVRDVVDATGAVIDHLVYNSFGQVASETNAAVHHLQGYAGGIADPETGLVNFWHRWYDPATGRWISQDPIGLSAQDPNLARYSTNNPTNLIDPSGYFGEPPAPPDPENYSSLEEFEAALQEWEAAASQWADENRWMPKPPLSQRPSEDDYNDYVNRIPDPWKEEWKQRTEEERRRQEAIEETLRNWPSIQAPPGSANAILECRRLAAARKTRYTQQNGVLLGSLDRLFNPAYGGTGNLDDMLAGIGGFAGASPLPAGARSNPFASPARPGNPGLAGPSSVPNAKVSGRNPPISPRQQLHVNGTPGKSQFKPGIDVEAAVRAAWESGTPEFDSNGNFLGKRYTFNSPVGTSPSGYS